MQLIVDNMNIPYGKSAVDKLYALQSFGIVHDNDLSNVLSEEHLQDYHKEVN
jgi:hypothetical protein